MNARETVIRVAAPADAVALLQIYTPYVLHTAISFEIEVPGPAEFGNRLEKTLMTHPYIVAEQHGELLGYAYTSPFVPRAAYDRTAATTIYLQQNQRGKGLGRRLYTALEDISRAQHILSLYACIGYPDEADEHLSDNSVGFHEHMGYRRVGDFRHCGYKFDTWYNMVWMEKRLGSHSSSPAPFVAFSSLSREERHRLGV